MDENYEKKKSLSNIERHHIKGSKGWEKFLVNKLFNKQYENGDVYNNILIKALMIGNNGAFWAYSSNINISPFQFDKIQKLFNQNSIKFYLYRGYYYQSFVQKKIGNYIEYSQEVLFQGFWLIWPIFVYNNLY